jgi:hypothetical protein
MIGRTKPKNSILSSVRKSIATAPQPSKRKLAILLPVVSQHGLVDPQQSGALSCKRGSYFSCVSSRGQLCVLKSGSDWRFVDAVTRLLRVPTPPTSRCASTRSTSGKPPQSWGDPDATYIWERAWFLPPPICPKRPDLQRQAAEIYRAASGQATGVGSLLGAINLRLSEPAVFGPTIWPLF